MVFFTFCEKNKFHVRNLTSVLLIYIKSQSILLKKLLLWDKTMISPPEMTKNLSKLRGTWFRESFLSLICKILLVSSWFSHGWCIFVHFIEINNWIWNKVEILSDKALLKKLLLRDKIVISPRNDQELEQIEGVPGELFVSYLQNTIGILLIFTWMMYLYTIYWNQKLNLK